MSDEVPYHKNAKRFLQSALEYLTTYSWAILIIAIAAAAIFQIISNTTIFVPKEQTGSCNIYRPNGPGTTAFIQATGACQGIPNFAAIFSGSYSNVSSTKAFVANVAATTGYTISLWVYPMDPSSNMQMIIGQAAVSTTGKCDTGSATANVFCLSYSNAAMIFANCAQDFTIASSPATTTSQWHHVVIVMNSSINAVYLNGTMAGSVANPTSSCNNNVLLSIGSASGNGDYFKGYLSNVQVYNTSLSPNDIKALFIEGIGGAPMRLNNLVTWVVLNGDYKDYSGDYYTFTGANVPFTTSWSNGYVAP